MSGDSTDVRSRLNAAFAGRYDVERELGAGGMATVYLTRDVRHDRHVALKVLHADLAHALGAERFLQEIRVTARLEHPHILTLIDSGELQPVDGGPALLYYVMPCVDGESLRERMARERQLPLADAMRLAAQVADALGYAHDHGVVHRDIKPENILLSGEHVKVADFGIARATEAQTGVVALTATGVVVMTRAFLALARQGDLAEWSRATARITAAFARTGGLWGHSGAQHRRTFGLFLEGRWRESADAAQRTSNAWDNTQWRGALRAMEFVGSG